MDNGVDELLANEKLAPLLWPSPSTGEGQSKGELRLNQRLPQVMLFILRTR